MSPNIVQCPTSLKKTSVINKEVLNEMPVTRYLTLIPKETAATRAYLKSNDKTEFLQRVYVWVCLVSRCGGLLRRQGATAERDDNQSQGMNRELVAKESKNKCERRRSEEGKISLSRFRSGHWRRRTQPYIMEGSHLRLKMTHTTILPLLHCLYTRGQIFFLDGGIPC